MIDFIAEIGSNFVTGNKPSKERALTLIRSAAQHGATAVKFQLIKANELYRDQDKVNALRPMELPVKWLPELKSACDFEGVEFLCTPFYEDAVEILMPYVERWKIASWELSEVGHINPVIKAIADTEMPVIMSTAGATMEEVEFALEVLRPGDEQYDDVVLMHCNPSYPTGTEHADLRHILTLGSEFFPVQVGFSCHVPNPVIAASSVLYQAETIEVHYDLEDRLGVESAHSLNPEKFSKMVSMANMLQKAMKGTARESDVKFSRKNYRKDPSDWLRGVK